MNTLQEIENFINEFNQNNKEDFSIDSIRIEFSKQHKKDKLDELGNWKKINKNDKTIMDKLMKRLTVNEVTSVMRLEKYNIYYYNSNKDKPKYRTATMVIFGLKQYHKAPPPHHIVSKILSILKDVTNIDICLDIPYKPNIELLKKSFTLSSCFKNGVLTDTGYINNPNLSMIERIVIYDKAFKNGLDGVLWRIEALVSIPNIKLLALPLQEFKSITDIAKGAK